MKLSIPNLKNLIENCTSTEISLLFHILQYQDEYGIIKGIDYKDIIEEIEIAKSTFYKTLKGLEDKGILEINYMHNNYSMWEVQICNNVFRDGNYDDYSKGYFNVNYSFLHSHCFYDLTKGEKVLAVELIRAHNRRPKDDIVVSTIKKITDWTGNSILSVGKFINTLSLYFNISVENNRVTVSCENGCFSRNKCEKDTFNEYNIKYELKIRGYKSSDESIKDACVLAKQYAGLGRDAFRNALIKSIDNFGEIKANYMNTILSTKSKEEKEKVNIHKKIEKIEATQTTTVNQKVEKVEEATQTTDVNERLEKIAEVQRTINEKLKVSCGTFQIEQILKAAQGNVEKIKDRVEKAVTQNIHNIVGWLIVAVKASDDQYKTTSKKARSKFANYSSGRVYDWDKIEALEKNYIKNKINPSTI